MWIHNYIYIDITHSDIHIKIFLTICFLLLTFQVHVETFFPFVQKYKGYLNIYNDKYKCVSILDKPF